MNSESISPKEMVIGLMIAAVPERADEIRALWGRYNPEVIIVDDRKGITLNATRERICFDAKTPKVFWVIGFNAWKAIECYAPAVIVSAASGRTVAEVLKGDDGLDDVERLYKERRATAQAMIETDRPDTVPWPDLPHPVASRGELVNDQDKLAFDLTCSAVAFALFHEFRHVMLDRDGERHADRREEELACDVWARDFMTAKLAEYAADNARRFDEVLQRRAMGMAVAALFLHEVTPLWDHGGNQYYFSIATRLQTLLEGTALPPESHFWVHTASLLVGVFRQKHVSLDAPPLNPRALTSHLIAEL